MVISEIKIFFWKYVLDCFSFPVNIMKIRPQHFERVPKAIIFGTVVEIESTG